MLAAGHVKDVNALSDNTFVVVCMVITLIPSLSITFNHIVLGFVINFHKTSKFKDVFVKINGASFSTTTGCC